MSQGKVMTATLFGLGAVFFLSVIPGGYAQTRTGDPSRGREVAQRVCATCHIIAPGQAGAATVGIPTFPAIARRPEQTVERLMSKMMVPHPPMPAIALTADEMRDIAAYILSLREGQ
jgi:mono/diheme cytochrome c family protein